MTVKVPQMSAALLCGGASERLGFPKEMLRVDGAPLAVRLVKRLREAFETVFVVTNAPDFLRHRLDVPIYRDEFVDAGPLAGLHAGLKNAGTNRCLFLACDMPLVHNDLLGRLARHALEGDASAVVASAAGRRQPLCGVYSKDLLPMLEERLRSRADLSVNGFLDRIAAGVVEFGPAEAGCFRDIDGPEDVGILRGAFADVEPLPVLRVPVTGNTRHHDVVMAEWPVAVYVNDLKLVTVLCLPTALRELAVGLGCYLGLVRRGSDVTGIAVDYNARRVMLQVDAEESAVRKAAQLLITSTCGANVYGAQEPPAPMPERPGVFRVGRSHILHCLKQLRGMAPVFSRTGGTHQAAFSDGNHIRLFFEDIGRHNAVDKVIGRAILARVDLSQGVIISTGRLSSEMIVKAARRRVPVLASRSAVTTNAIRLAENYGLTLVGFARGGRANVYTNAERIRDD